MDDDERLRNRIIGLGEHSFKKSFYPELQKKIDELNLFKAIFDQTGESILIFKPENGFIEYFNDAASAFFNIQELEFNKYITDLVSKKYWNTVADVFIQAKEKNSASTFNYKVNLNLNGNYRYIHNSISVIHFSGEVLGLVIITDITQRIKIEQDLILEKEKVEQSNKYKSSILNALPDMMFAIDINGIFVDYYTDVETELYSPPEGFLSKHINEVLPPNIAKLTFDAVKEVLSTKKLYDYSYSLKVQGKKRVFHSRMVYVDEKTTLAIVKNITERENIIDELKTAKTIAERNELEIKLKNEQLLKTEDDLRITNNELVLLNQKLEKQTEDLQIAKEKAEESDKLKSAFLANMSHEIRTPLNGILGFANLLTEGNPSQEAKRNFAQIINSSSDDLLRIIDDILDISKIESGQVNLNKTTFDLHVLMNQLLNMYKQKIIESGKNIEIKQTMPDEKTRIYTDKTRLKQILINLMDNALKYTEKGFIELGCREEDSTWLFFVRDSGLGIKKEHQQVIFDRFRQINTQTFNPVRGTGIGLSICKGLVNEMGGHIWVDSVENKGSGFFFTLPCKVPA